MKKLFLFFSIFPSIINGDIVAVERGDLGKQSVVISDVDEERDFEEIIRLYKENISNLYPDVEDQFSPDKIRSEIRNKIISFPDFSAYQKSSFYMKVIRDSDNLIGVISYFTHNYPDGVLIKNSCYEKYGDAIGMIWMLVVDRRYRKQGYGTKLIKHALDSMAKEVKFAIISVEKNNKLVRELYEKIGFKLLGEFETYPAEIVLGITL